MSKPSDPLSGYTYAIGDLHGRPDVLIAALNAIERHAGTSPSKILLLGDYIDRGPDSRTVVEILLAGPRRPQDCFVCLKGNHEEMLCTAAAAPEDRSALWFWASNGGIPTLLSYGQRPGGRLDIDHIPASHRQWLEGLSLIEEDPHRIFVHAGLMPGVQVSEQSRNVLLSIREPFLSATEGFLKHVVHGHTPREDGPELLPWRTNLDTGAFWTGRLAVGVFDPNQPGGPIDVLEVAGADPRGRHGQAHCK